MVEARRARRRVAGSGGSGCWFDHHYCNVIYIVVVSCDSALRREGREVGALCRREKEREGIGKRGGK